METPVYSPKSPLVSKCAPRGGFALVIALSLMAFILLLLLSITTLVRVETQSAEISLSTLKARQNALLGAMIAVGELQEHAGPDQRVTSDTDYIFGVNTLVVRPPDPNADPDNPPPPEDPGVTLTVNQRRWTGVWKEQIVDGYRTPQHLMWLVSGNEAVDPDNPDFQLVQGGNVQTSLLERPTYDNGVSPEDNGTVWMVHDGSVGNSDTTNYVQAPVVSFDGGEGAYAWWVGDEGLKAPLTLENPHAGTELSYRVAQKPDFTNVAELGSAFETSASRTRLASIEELELAGATVNAPKDRFFDVTPFSLGVLSDSRLGGLRKDLTRAFAPDTAAALKLIHDDLVEADPTRTSDTAKFIFAPAGGAPTADDPGGPLWEQLRDYYNLRPTSANTIDLTVGGTNIPSIHQTDEQMGIYPVISWFQLRYYLTMTDEPGDPLNPSIPVTRKLVLWYLPSLSLWNPYDVDLVVPDLYLKVLTDLDNDPQGQPDVDRDNLNFLWRAFRVFKDTGKTDGPTISKNIRPLEVDDKDDPLPLILKIKGTTIPAGQSAFFSPSSNSEVYPSDAWADTPNADENLLSNSLASGPNYGFWYINDNPTYNRSEFEYIPDPDDNFIYRGAFPKESLSLDLHVTLSTSSGFEKDSIVQSINHIENRYGSAVSPINIEPLEESPTTAPFINDPVAMANSFMMVWTNTWYSNPLPNGKIPPWRYPWLGLNNPRASFVGRSGYETDIALAAAALSGDEAQNPPGYNSHGSSAGQLKNSANWDVSIVKDSSEKGFVGWHYERDDVFMIDTDLFEIPKAEDSILSIGQFMHANLSRNNNFDTNSLSLIPGNRHLYNNYTPAYAIGNSRADPRIPLVETDVNWSSDVTGVGSITGTHYDYSYLLNEALWDRYFISAIPESGNIPDPLPNARLVRSAFDESLTDSDRKDFDRAAVSYMVDGAFNVNSSSVEAWKALLSSFLGMTVTLSDGVSDSGSGSPFPRFNNPNAAEFQNGTDAHDSEEAYNGFRRLTQDEISQLANAIVAEMKRAGGRRNPFLTVADFVNRNLSTGDTQAKVKGILQAAIDATDINKTITADDSGVTATNSDGVMELADGDIPETGGAPGYTVEAFDGVPYAANVPGFLSQADILARIGPVLSARSDTFRIRTYGEVKDPHSGDTVSSVWCELLVQRTPGFVDENDLPETAVTSLTSSINERFGRKFRILSLRWLSEEEI